MKLKNCSLTISFWQDIELIFKRACEDSKWNVALRAKELLFRYSTPERDDADDDVALWSDERLEKVLNSLKNSHNTNTKAKAKAKKTPSKGAIKSVAALDSPTQEPPP